MSAHGTRLEVRYNLGGRDFIVETGAVAKQADGAVLVTFGESIVLVTATASRTIREGIDFFPLVVDYQEMAYAAGKIPGGFFKREGRPSEKEILTSRLIDRPLRPLFPKGFLNEVQIIATVLSADQENDPDVLAICGASAALEISDIPFQGPIAGVRVGRIQGQWVCNPTVSQLKESDVNLIVAGSREGVVMVEGGGQEISEEELLEAIFFGHRSLQPILGIQEELKGKRIELENEQRKAAGEPEIKTVEKKAVPELSFDPVLGKPVLLADESIRERIRTAGQGKILQALAIARKKARNEQLEKTRQETLAPLLEEFPEKAGPIKAYYEALEKFVVRRPILQENRRVDGRAFNEVRPIHIQVGWLPRTHGSARFTRGETQVSAVVTLGSADDEQKIDALTGETFKSFMLHYNFPPYSVGEVRMMRGPSRRDIGHGALAERSISRILPSNEKNPYTIRIVSEVLESNGSSSMATVCGASLALMDAGIQIKRPVAGIAMGLIKEGEKVVVLTDILGDEDHHGDMDFKVAGSRTGITGFQMDIKISGVTRDILRQALAQAREGREFILGKMENALSGPRAEMSPYAPRFLSLRIKPDRIREIIGPQGKIIRGIQDETGVKINVEDDGSVHIFSPDSQAAQRAADIIREMIKEAQVGEFYMGRVASIARKPDGKEFGAFVEIFPGTDGLVHISQLANERVRNVEDVLKQGDQVLVKVIGIDERGKIKLSRKEALGHPWPEKK
ncbi:MAG: polyribonucleotide nucleotidyltransferase [Deltaproteobacteria bacterium]|jgi:polyribonucleotide nucleotidyltransferase|nr:polyribonucleotide nucleotidyltransferase [Deltaproteobacteria bacterium]